MNFQTVITELTKLGYTQTAIAAECGCAKSTITEIKLGAIAMPSWDLGQKLSDLHKRAVAANRRKKARSAQ